MSARVCPGVEECIHQCGLSVAAAYKTGLANARRVQGSADLADRLAAVEGLVAGLDDALCDALCAARIGKYDGQTVETHLEHLIERIRAALDAEATS
jgi:hypothetical protein